MSDPRLRNFARATPALLGWLLLAVLPAVQCPARGADWKTDANARIEQLRQRSAQLTVVDDQGRPVANAQIELKQVRQAFPFGAAISAAILRNPQYQEFFTNHFNWAVFENESKWYSNERVRGRFDYAGADAMLAWCRSNQIPVRGHCLFWEPAQWQPAWLRALGSNDLRAAVEARLESAVTHFRGQFQQWDVDNEMLHGDFFRTNLGEAIHPWMFKRAHELDPSVKLFVNEFNILSVDQNFKATQTEEYVADIKRLIAAGARVQGVGIQGHLWNENILQHPEVIKERLDQVAALKLPIWITEFDAAGTNEMENADKLELVYRTAFSHPAVEGIVTWVMWAGNSWRGTNAGLARADWTLNEAGRRFEQLMREWSTTASGQTDRSGAFKFRGFCGEYEATITVPGNPALLRKLVLPPGIGAARLTLEY